MPDTDIVATDLKVSLEGIFNLADLYHLIKDWLEFNGYNFFEKEYIDTLAESGKTMSVTLVGDRKVNDYAKMNIQVKIKVENAKEVEFKKGTGLKGKITIGFESFVERDYEKEWEKNFLLRFIRAVYDKFIIKEKLDEYHNELDDETQGLYHKVKAFLNMAQFKV